MTYLYYLCQIHLLTLCLRFSWSVQTTLALMSLRFTTEIKLNRLVRAEMEQVDKEIFRNLRNLQGPRD